MIDSTCSSSVFTFWTSLCFDLRADGKALGFDVDTITLSDVSLVYREQSSHLIIWSEVVPVVRGMSEPQWSQNNMLPIATIFVINRAVSFGLRASRDSD